MKVQIISVYEKKYLYIDFALNFFFNYNINAKTFSSSEYLNLKFSNFGYCVILRDLIRAIIFIKNQKISGFLKRFGIAF